MDTEHNHLGSGGPTWRAMVDAEMRRATPEGQRVMPATTQNLPPKHVVFAEPKENPRTPEHIVWREQQRDGSVLVGFENGEVWRGALVLNPATERRNVEQWTLHGHWQPTD